MTRAGDDAFPGGPRRGRLGRVHDRVLEALGTITSGVPAERALAQVFRRARDLGPSERAEVSDTVYGVVRRKRNIDSRIARTAKAMGKKIELLEAPMQDRLRVLVHMADQGAAVEELKERDAYAFGRIPGLIARMHEGRVPPLKAKSSAERIGVEHSIPDWLAERLVSAYGDPRAEEIAIALELRAPLAIRANHRIMSREALAERLREEHGVEAVPAPLAPHGLILPSHVPIESFALFEQGAFEVQDEASQLVALAVGAQPGETVIDACAGAGGKTLALAALMGNSGRIHAVEPEAQRLEELKERARRAGISNFEPVVADFVTFPAKLEGRADRVLVDAPCSGTGTLRRQPDARWRIQRQDLARFPGLEKTLLLRALDAARPGGHILYASCSLLPEEGEGVVSAVLAEDPRAEAVPLASTLGDALASKLEATHSARIGPGPGPADPDGFYLALLRRRA